MGNYSLLILIVFPIISGLMVGLMPAFQNKKTRQLFTAGVLDCFMEEGIVFDYVIGSSSGVCNAMNYVSGQIGTYYLCWNANQNLNPRAR